MQNVPSLRFGAVQKVSFIPKQTGPDAVQGPVTDATKRVALFRTVKAYTHGAAIIYPEWQLPHGLRGLIEAPTDYFVVFNTPKSLDATNFEEAFEKATKTIKNMPCDLGSFLNPLLPKTVPFQLAGEMHKISAAFLRKFRNDSPNFVVRIKHADETAVKSYCEELSKTWQPEQLQAGKAIFSSTSGEMPTH